MTDYDPYELPTLTTYTTTRVWALAPADRVLMTETAPAGRQFSAHHVAVTWDQDGNVVKVHAAGVEQSNGKPLSSFVGDVWHEDPPEALTRFYIYPAAVSS